MRAKVCGSMRERRSVCVHGVRAGAVVIQRVWYILILTTNTSFPALSPLWENICFAKIKTLPAKMINSKRVLSSEAATCWCSALSCSCPCIILWPLMPRRKDQDRRWILEMHVARIAASAAAVDELELQRRRRCQLDGSIGQKTLITKLEKVVPWKFCNPQEFLSEVREVSFIVCEETYLLVWDWHSFFSSYLPFIATAAGGALGGHWLISSSCLCAGL